MARVVYVSEETRVEAHIDQGALYDQENNYQDYDDSLEPIAVGKRSYDYVSFQAEGPLAGLIWKEVRKVLKKARLTMLQAAVVELHLLGHSDEEIATQLKTVDGVERTRQTIFQAREGADEKLGNLKHLGVLTILYEEFRRRPVNELQADRFEEKMQKLC